MTDSLGDGGRTSEELNKKPTGLMTNVPEIAETVQKSVTRCTGMACWSVAGPLDEHRSTHRAL